MSKVSVLDRCERSRKWFDIGIGRSSATKDQPCAHSPPLAECWLVGAMPLSVQSTRSAPRICATCIKAAHMVPELHTVQSSSAENAV